MDHTVSKLFNDLETKNLVELEETKKRFIELFNSTKESWLSHGIMDYYYQTHSIRIVDVLVKVPVTHERFIFDKLLEWMKGPSKVPALSLLGHIIMRHPSWLYRVESHPLFKEVLRLLKTEREVIPVMSALLCLITLLPTIPYLVRRFMDDLFEVFSHLAAWNSHKWTVGGDNMPEEQLGHLQIGLYLYFQRLYGMFPCNLIEYLKQEYTTSATGGHMTAKNAIFTHTILPLLETVRMHPMLITDTPETEKSDRWRKWLSHDIVAECCKLSVDSCDNHQSQYHNQQHNKCHDREMKTIFELTTVNRLELKMNVQHAVPKEYETFWTPSQMVPFISPGGASLQSTTSSVSAPPSAIQNTPTNIQIPVIVNQPFIGGIGGTSPPEAAVEATPETTPMKDQFSSNVQQPYPPAGSGAVRAIGLSGSSQPSSPMKKDTFRYPSELNLLDKPFSRLYSLQMDSATGGASGSIAPPSPLQGGGGSSGPTISSIAQPIQAKGEKTESMKLTEPFPGSTTAAAAAASGHQQSTQGQEPSKYELSQSPCSVGGLHMPNSKSIQEFRQYSLYKDTASEVSSASEIEVNSSEASGDDGPTSRKTCAAQTDSQWNSTMAYEHMFVQLSRESKSDGAAAAEGGQGERRMKIFSPNEILDKIIESSVAKKRALNAKDAEEFYKSQIQLLNFQLLFERHQREEHAERIRRLFGKSRDYKVLELNNETLNNQVKLLMMEVEGLQAKLQLNQANTAKQEAELTHELKTWKLKFGKDQDEMRVLRQTLELTQNRLSDEERANKERNQELENVKGELFDLRNEKSGLTYQASLSNHYQEQLVRLQSEFLITGEMHQHYRDRLEELEQSQDRERQNELLRLTTERELDDMQTALQQKTNHLEAALVKIFDLEQQLSKREMLVTDQKRVLKVAKEEYEERFEALENKYETQKKIIVKMEEHLLELFRNPGAYQDPMRSEMVSSAEHASSPLSLSLTSSDGLSTSLRSVAEIKSGPSASNSTSNFLVGSSSSQTLKAPASDVKSIEQSAPAKSSPNPSGTRQSTTDEATNSPKK